MRSSKSLNKDFIKNKIIEIYGQDFMNEHKDVIDGMLNDKMPSKHLNIKHDHPYTCLGLALECTNDTKPAVNVIYTKNGRVFSRNLDEFFIKMTKYDNYKSRIDEIKEAHKDRFIKCTEYDGVVKNFSAKNCGSLKNDVDEHSINTLDVSIYYSPNAGSLKHLIETDLFQKHYHGDRNRCKIVSEFLVSYEKIPYMMDYLDLSKIAPDKFPEPTSENKYEVFITGKNLNAAYIKTYEKKEHAIALRELLCSQELIDFEELIDDLELIRI